MKRTYLLISILMTTMMISCGGVREDTSTNQSIRLYNSEPIHLYAWGKNDEGQLGNGESGNDMKSTTPIVIGLKTSKVFEESAPIAEIVNTALKTKSWKQVSAGKKYTVAIMSDGTLYAWGRNNAGQLGIGNTNNQNAPVKIGTDTWKQVSAGGTHTVAIMSDGLLYAWGNNGSGQLGNGESGTNVKSVTPIEIEPTKTWKQVSAGGNHTVAIDSDGALFVWGKNNAGQLGRGDKNIDNSNEPIKIGTKTWKQVSAGGEHTVAIDSVGILYAWGNNSNGQLGVGSDTIDGNETLVFKYIPVEVVIETDTSKTWTQVSAGIGTEDLNFHTMAIDSDGALYAWGKNDFGQLGDGSNDIQIIPKKIGNKTWAQVSTGAGHTVAIDSTGILYAWGENNSGQLGIGNETDQTTPVVIEESKTWKQASAGFGYTVAILK